MIFCGADEPETSGCLLGCIFQVRRAFYFDTLPNNLCVYYLLSLWKWWRT